MWPRDLILPEVIHTTSGKFPKERPLLFPAGWEADVVAETQVATLNNRRKPYAVFDCIRFSEYRAYQFSYKFIILGLLLYRKEVNFCLYHFVL